MTPHFVFVALPEGWEQLDLAEPGAEASITSVLDERLAQSGVSPTERQPLVGVAISAIRHARRIGVVVWAIRLPVPDLSRLATLTVGITAIPPGGALPPEATAEDRGAVPYISAPSDPRPLDLLFEGVSGYVREWRLASEPNVLSATSLFCVQAMIISLSSPVVVTVSVTAFEPTDCDELREVAATVARSLRLVPATTP